MAGWSAFSGGGFAFALTKCGRASTDSLYIDLSEEQSVESREISEGVVLDYNAAGQVVGIDIDEASKQVQLDKLVLSQLPSAVETAAA